MTPGVDESGEDKSEGLLVSFQLRFKTREENLGRLIELNWAYGIHSTLHQHRV